MSFDWNRQKQLHKKYSLESKKKMPDSQLSEYTDIAKQAYSKKPKSDLGDWHLITHDSNNKVYQNRRTGEIVNGISGSKSLSDFTNDGLQILGLSNNSLQKKRYADSALMMDRILSVERAPTLSTASHSLGSNISNRLMKHGKVTGMNYNHNGFYARKSDNIDSDRVVNIRNKHDLASILSRNNENSITLDGSSNPLKAHFIDQLDTLQYPKK
jgi:hypothetical protein